MMKSLALLLSAFFALSAAKTCKYDSSNFESYWRVANNSIILQFTNTDIKNNEWTGIGFGDNKNSLVGVFFMVTNNQVAVRAGSTTEHGPPTFTQNGANSANIQPVAAYYFPEDETMSAVVQIPLQFSGRSLQTCQKWRWIKSGKIEGSQLTRNDKSPKDKKVCPTECT